MKGVTRGRCLGIPFLLLAIIHTAFATTIVGIVKGDQIVFAADSKLSESLPKCKLFLGTGTVIGVAGNFNSRLLKAIESASTANVTPSAKAVLLDNLIGPEIPIVGDGVRQYDKPMWDLAIAGRISIVSVAIGGFENSRAVIVRRRYRINESMQVNIEKGIWPEGNEATTLVTLGIDGEIQKYRQDHPRWLEGDLSETARMFVKFQIKANPRTVGDPISIYEITKEGARWLECGVCQPCPEKIQRQPLSPPPKGPRK